MERISRTATAWLLTSTLLTACTGATNSSAGSPKTSLPGTSGASPSRAPSKDHPCAPVPSEKAVEGLAPGGSKITKARVTSRQEVVRQFGIAGFPVLVILPLGAPTQVEFDLESDRELIARTMYTLSGGRTVQVIQTCAIHLPLVGRDVRVRGRHGINDGGSVRWVERGYMLAVTPGKDRYAQALLWRTASAS